MKFNFWCKRSRSMYDKLVKAEMKVLNRELKLWAKYQNQGLKPMQAFDVTEGKMELEFEHKLAKRLKNQVR